MSFPDVRVTFAGARRLARYNWPLYAFAGLMVFGGILVASLSMVPLSVRCLAAVGAAGAVWFASASFLAFHWMFDRSELTRWQWLIRVLGQPPARWVLITAGLEETTGPLGDIFPGTDGKILDIYDPASMTEPAITRARRQKAGVSAISTRLDALPVEDGWSDAVFVVLAAHEIRDAVERERFFHELTRILSQKGKVVLVEHLRDFASALAFGPGFFHFLPRREWLRLGSLARLRLESELSFTPFVRVFVYGASSP